MARRGRVGPRVRSQVARGTGGWSIFQERKRPPIAHRDSTRCTAEVRVGAVTLEPDSQEISLDRIPTSNVGFDFPPHAA